MKSMIFLSLCLLAMIMANPNEPTHNAQHTFLVKTDLTKEQVENLLNEYHRNHTAHTLKTQEEIALHQNETTHLKVKKEKELTSPTKPNHEITQELKKKTPPKLQNKEKKHAPKQETPKPPETQEPPEAPETPEPPKAPEPPEAPEAPESPEAPEAPEQPEAPEALETETTQLKKKQKNKKKLEQNKVTEVNETQEIEEAEAEIVCPNKTELIEKANCTEEKVNLMQTNVKKSNSKILEFLFAAFLTFAFVSLFIYSTQPKKSKKINHTFNELTDYLLVKENQNKKYDIKNF